MILKEIDMQVLEAQRVPNKMDAKRLTPRHIIIKMPKVKKSEKILREKKLVTYRGVPIRLSSDFSKETVSQKGLSRNAQRYEKHGLIAKIALPSKDIIQNQRADKEFPRQGKTKGVRHHQTIII